MAVYTQVTPEELNHFISKYNIGELYGYDEINEGIENTNYVLQTINHPSSQPKKYILTLYEKRVKQNDLPYFLALLEHLNRNNVTCPMPLYARDGKSLQRLCGKPAVILSFIPGICPQHESVNHCVSLGKAVAKMHIAGFDFPLERSNDMSLKNWAHLTNITQEYADKLKPGLQNILISEIDYLLKNWPRNLPTGIIHADLFPDNVFFLDSEISGLIDFYFACNDFLVYDLAICINAWCFDSDFSFNINKTKALLRGYEQLRSLSNDEISAIPILVRGSAIRFLLTRLYDKYTYNPNTNVTPKNPIDYLHRLQFHQNSVGLETYGLDKRV